jgi:DNA-binding response OmpR family regulator
MTDTALLPPAQAESPESPGPALSGRGTLLGVIPAGRGSARLAIVGYLLSPVPAESGAPGERLAEALVVDAARHRVVVRGGEVDLVLREFQLLTFLIANPDRVFTRSQLLARVWASAPDRNTRTVDIHVCRLRRKLGPDVGRRLVTVRGVGYLYQVLDD